MTLSKQRAVTFPQMGDDWESVARRHFPDLDVNDAVSQLQSWNLHMLAGRKPEGMILGSDIIFLEAPTERVRHLYPGKDKKS